MVRRMRKYPWRDRENHFLLSEYIKQAEAEMLYSMEEYMGLWERTEARLFWSPILYRRYGSRSRANDAL